MEGGVVPREVAQRRAARHVWQLMEGDPRGQILFETFIRLKWIKVWKVYTVSFIILCLFMVSMITFTLLNYSNIFVHTDATLKQVFWVLLLVTTVLLSLLHAAKLHHLLCRSCVTRSAKHN